MGSGDWSKAAYTASSAAFETKGRDDIFTTKTASAVDDSMLPFNVAIRESRDSDAHPTSLALMVCLDVTGSMGTIPEQLVKGKLGEVMNTLIDHGIKDPQIMFCGVGDHECDRVPLQISQFESADKELQHWLTKIFLEGGGGGNAGESYILPWYFAARSTSIDCFEKRGEKGFIFTIGDEPYLPSVPADALKKIFGSGEALLTAEQLLAEAQRTYHVFHIHIAHGSARSGNWKDLLGQNLITIDDHNIVAEIIASTVAYMHGVDVTSSFDAATADKVTTALAHVDRGVAKNTDKVVNL